MKGPRLMTDEEWLNHVIMLSNGCMQFISSRTGKPVVSSKYCRKALEIKLGRKIKKDMQINHHCDNGVNEGIGCVNPKHIWEGAQLENMRDAIDKGRMHTPEQNKKASDKMIENPHKIPYRYGRLGKHNSKEHREKQSKALMGHILSEKTLEKISKSAKDRKHCSTCIHKFLCIQEYDINGYNKACDNYEGKIN